LPGESRRCLVLSLWAK